MSEYVTECNPDGSVKMDAEKAVDSTKNFEKDKIKSAACDNMKCNAFCYHSICPDIGSVMQESCDNAKQGMAGCDVDCSGASRFHGVSGPKVVLISLVVATVVPWFA